MFAIIYKCASTQGSCMDTFNDEAALFKRTANLTHPLLVYACTHAHHERSLMSSEP